MSEECIACCCNCCSNCCSDCCQGLYYYAIFFSFRIGPEEDKDETENYKEFLHEQINPMIMDRH
jgi:hypothetical protein